MIETWREIPDTQWYQVSNLGRVRSVDRTVLHSDGKTSFRKGKVLKATIASNGYPMVYIVFTDGTRRNVTVHSLVARAFIGERPDGYYICHSDGDRTNARVDNLRYDTPINNSADARQHGTTSRDAKTHCGRGHEMRDENLYVSIGGRRQCRACALLTSMEARRRRSGFYDRNPDATNYV